MFNFLKDKSIINKIIIINAVVSVCIILFLVFNNFYIKDELNKRTAYNNKTLLTEFQNKFFAEADRIKNVGTLVLNETEVTGVKRLPKNSAAQIESIRSLKNQCSFISTFFDYTASMNIHLKNNGIVINENGSVDREYFNISPETSPYFSGEEAIDFEKLETGFYPYSSYILYVNNRTNDTSLYFAISKDMFISFLEESDQNYDGGFAIFFDGELLTASKSVPDSLDYAKISKNKKVYKDEDGKKYGIVTQNREFYEKPLTFAYIYTYNQYEKIASYVNLYTWLSIIIFLFINLCAVFVQYITYIPIRKMASDFDSFENGRNEIHTIRTAFESLKNDNIVMQDLIERNERFYEGQALLKLMLGEKRGIDKKMLDTLSLKFKKYVVIYVLPSSGFTLLADFEETVSEKYYIERMFTDTKSKKYVVACESSSEFAEFLSQTLKSLNASSSVIIGISEEYEDISSLNTAYAESSQVVYKCPVERLLENNVLIYENSEFKNAFSVSWEREHGLINAVLGGDVEKTEAFFDDYLWEKVKNVSYENFKRIYSRLMTVLKGIADTNHIEVATQTDDGEISVSAIHAFARESYTEAAESFKYSQRKSMYDSVLEYINANIDKTLSVNSIAYSLKITPEYLSSYFKKMSGVNISTYISNAKMEKAKEILRSKKNVKISEVAEMVGIDQVNTFNRKFKKYTGETPSSFKQKFDS